MTKVDWRELGDGYWNMGPWKKKRWANNKDTTHFIPSEETIPVKKSHSLPVPRPDQILDLKPISWKRICVFKRKDPEHHDRCTWHIQPIGSDQGKNTRHFNKWRLDWALLGMCDGLDVCAPTPTPESMCWNPNPKYDGIGRLWEVIQVIWGHEVGD